MKFILKMLAGLWADIETVFGYLGGREPDFVHAVHKVEPAATGKEPIFVWGPPENSPAPRPNPKSLKDYRAMNMLELLELPAVKVFDLIDEGFSNKFIASILPGVKASYVAVIRWYMRLLKDHTASKRKAMYEAFVTASCTADWIGMTDAGARRQVIVDAVKSACPTAAPGSIASFVHNLDVLTAWLKVSGRDVSSIRTEVFRDGTFSRSVASVAADNNNDVADVEGAPFEGAHDTDETFDQDAFDRSLMEGQEMSSIGRDDVPDDGAPEKGSRPGDDVALDLIAKDFSDDEVVVNTGLSRSAVKNLRSFYYLWMVAIGVLPADINKSKRKTGRPVSRKTLRMIMAWIEAGQDGLELNDMVKAVQTAGGWCSTSTRAAKVFVHNMNRLEKWGNADSAARFDADEWVRLPQKA